jgi:uncharacterized membrane protein
MSVNGQLLQRVRERGQKQSQFRYGIMTADRHVLNLQEQIGMGRCYQFMSHGNSSYSDLLSKASKTLVYANEDMEGLAEKFTDGTTVNQLSLPKNTLIAFRHCLTSSRKDRDGDVLHSDGAVVDPNMLMLWQHVHTMPIGKFLTVTNKNPKRLEVVSAIVDMNALCHDAAVMVDNGMARFSHGFRAMSFHETKEGPGNEGGGFDVKQFEIMEESLVSVPANPDAEVDEVILSLVEGNKLTSPIMKDLGQSIRSKRALVVPGITITKKAGGAEEQISGLTFDQLQKLSTKTVEESSKSEEIVVENKEKTDANESGVGEGSGGAGESQDGSSTSAQADATPPVDKSKRTEEADDEKVECAGCGEKVTPDTEGCCPECGEPVERGETRDKNATPDGTKAGRVLNKSNEALIRKAKDHVDDVHTNCKELGRGHGAQLREASSHLATVLKAVEIVETEQTPEDNQDANTRTKPVQHYSVQSAAAHFLAYASAEERARLAKALDAIDIVEKSYEVGAKFRRMMGVKEVVEKVKAEGPQIFDGDLHKECHKGCEMIPGKAVHAYLTKCGMQVKDYTDDSADVGLTGKEVSAHMIKAGWGHKWFTEDGPEKSEGIEEKATRIKRVDAYLTGGMKATAIHYVGEKSVRVYMSKCSE